MKLLPILVLGALAPAAFAQTEPSPAPATPIDSTPAPAPAVSVPVPTTPLFRDVPPGHWAFAAVQRLGSAGIVEGYGGAAPAPTVARIVPRVGAVRPVSTAKPTNKLAGKKGAVMVSASKKSTKPAARKRVAANAKTAR